MTRIMKLIKSIGNLLYQIISYPFSIFKKTKNLSNTNDLLSPTLSEKDRVESFVDTILENETIKDAETLRELILDTPRDAVLVDSVSPSVENTIPVVENSVRPFMSMLNFKINGTTSKEI